MIRQSAQWLLTISALFTLGCGGGVTPAPEPESGSTPSESEPAEVEVQPTTSPRFEQLRVVSEAALSGSSPANLVCGDFDGDGVVDLVVSFGWGDPVRYRAGAAGLERGSMLQGRRALASGDLNGDGRLDLVLGARDPVGAMTYIGRGEMLVALTTARLPGAIEPPVALALADLDGDGALDLLGSLGASGGEGGLVEARGLGNGRFGAGRRHVLSSGALAAGDLNGDGRADAVVADGGGVSTFLSGAEGLQHTAYAGHDSGSPSSLALGDLDSDGCLDLVAGSRDPSATAVKLWRGTGDGKLTPLPAVTINRPPRAVALGDLDGDGDLDLIVAAADPGVVMLFANAGDGSFEQARVLEGLTGASAVLVANLDTDPALEIAVAGQRLVILDE